jgi:biotin carboxylase
MQGLEFGAQGLIYKNNMKFVFAHNDVVTPPPYLTPIGHSYPMSLTEKMENEIKDVIEKGTKALEIDNSLLNIDMILTSSGPRIIEIGARMGATCLPELTSIFSGIDVVDVAIEMALGNEPDLTGNEKRQPCAALLIRSQKTGILEIADLPKNLLDDSRLVSIRWDKKPGDKVNAFKTGPDRIGEIVVISDTSKEADKFCEELYGCLHIKVKEDGG